MHRSTWVVVVLLALSIGAPRTSARQREEPVQLASRVAVQPQLVESSGPAVQLDSSWVMMLPVDDAPYSLLWRWFTDNVATDEPLVLGFDSPEHAPLRADSVVVGNAEKHEFVEAALAAQGLAIPSNLGDEGYLLAVCGGHRPQVIVAANSASGAFYGVVTLAQLVDGDGTVPGVIIVDYPEHEVRGTYEPGSIRLAYENGAYQFTEENRAFIDWLASHKFNTVFTVENGAFFRDKAEWLTAYRELFDYARQRFIEPVPRICSISTVSPFDFEFYEGWFVEREQFAFDAQDLAVPSEPFQELIVNGDFELDANDDGVPDGWSLTNKEGATWTIDDTVAYSGSHSMRLSIPSPAADSNSATLRTTVSNVVPNSYYCLWAKARAVGVADVRPQLTMYVRNADREVTVLQSDVTWDTSGWKSFGTCITAPADSETITLYSRIQYPGTGRFWLDAVELYRVDGGLRNVIRADDTDIVVTDSLAAVTYQEGRDYEILDGETSIRFEPSLAPFRVRRLPGGGIAPGSEVLVSYDAYFFYKASEYWRSAPCVARDELYTEYYEPAIANVVEHLHPSWINIDADEVRGFYRDSRMRSRFASNAEAIAYWGNRIAGFLREVDPECRLWIWDDMVSPYHNGGIENYQVNYGGLPGRMAEATEKDMLDTSIIQDIWWYGDSRISQMWHSIQFFQDKGFDVLGSPWQSEENIASWSEMLLGQPRSLGGVETNWGTPYQQSHQWFGDHFWNTRYSLLLFDSFELDADGNDIPDGWQLEGAIAYSSDGSHNQGKRYAGFPNAAVGVITDTVGFSSDPLPVRANTEYVLSAYVKCSPCQDTEALLAIEWLNAAGAPVSRSEVQVETLTDEYHRFELQAASPAAAAEAVIALGEADPGVWYDIIRLKEKTVYLGIISHRKLPLAYAGVPYRVDLKAVGGVKPLRWTPVGEGLPPGFSLRDDGTLHGTPSPDSMSEARVLEVQVSDQAGRSEVGRFRLTTVAPATLYLPRTEVGLAR